MRLPAQPRTPAKADTPSPAAVAGVTVPPCPHSGKPHATASSLPPHKAKSNLLPLSPLTPTARQVQPLPQPPFPRDRWDGEAAGRSPHAALTPDGSRLTPCQPPLPRVSPPRGFASPGVSPPPPQPSGRGAPGAPPAAAGQGRTGQGGRRARGTGRAGPP